MGQFIVTIRGMGNHGCERGVPEGGHVLGCQRPDCVDCIAREVVRRLKRNGVQNLEAQLVHWPEAEGTPAGPVWPRGTVTDDLVTGVRRGGF